MSYYHATKELFESNPATSIYQLLDAIPVAAYICDPDGLITHFNSKAVEIWGRTPKLKDPEFRYCGSYRLYNSSGQLIPHDQSWMAIGLKQRKPFNGCKVIIEQENGTKRNFLNHINLLIDEEGEFSGAINVLIDITDIEQKRQETDKYLETFKQIVSNSFDILAFLEPDYTIRTANKATINLLEMSSEDIIGHKLHEIIGDKYFNRIQKPYIDRALTGELIEFEARYRDSNKRKRFFDITYIPSLDENGKVNGVITRAHDITTRKTNEISLNRSLRALRVLGACNSAITKIKDEIKLVQEVCEIIVYEGGYRFAWVGYPQNDAQKTVKPIAHAGYEMGYLNNLITWNENDIRGRGPTGTAIRTKTPLIVRNISEDPRFEPWRIPALKRGYHSTVPIPLIVDDIVIGALMIYSNEKNAFDQQEADFLCELADNLAFGIHTFRINQAIKESNEKLRNLSASLHKVREEERTMISHEIHDQLGQTLTGLRMDITWLLNELPKEELELRERTRKSLILVDETLDTVRRISHDLRPAILDDLGLVSAIEWQMEEFQARTCCDYDLELYVGDIGIVEERDTIVFRILQETLTNVTRHSNANFVKVTLNREKERLLLTVKDNGIGIKENRIKSNHSIGLIGMRERANQIGGEINIACGKQGGTIITLSIPL